MVTHPEERGATLPVPRVGVDRVRVDDATDESGDVVKVPSEADGFASESSGRDLADDGVRGGLSHQLMPYEPVRSPTVTAASQVKTQTKIMADSAQAAFWLWSPGTERTPVRSRDVARTSSPTSMVLRRPNS